MSRFDAQLRLGLASCCLWSVVGWAGPRVVVNANAQHFPRVELSVHATTKAGEPLTDLKPADFAIFEDLSAAKVVKVEQQRTATTTPVDVVFVFDITGSMQDEIDGLVRRTKRFADQLAQSGLDFELALLPFGDEVGSATAPTRNVTTFKNQVAALRAGGGGDEPENQLGALDAARRLPARPRAKRVLVLVTDAPFHAGDGVTPLRADEVVTSLREVHAELHVVGPSLDEYRWMTLALGGSFYDKDSGAFEQLVDTLGGELAANYVVTYDSPRPQRDGTRRSVTLTAKHASGTAEDASQYVAPALVAASSRQQGMQGDLSAFSPYLAVDGKPDTAWVSDVTSASEWLTLNFDSPQHVSRLTVRASDDPRFAVPGELAVSFDGQPAQRLKLSGERGEQTVAVEPVEAQSVRVTVVHRTPETQPVAIAELSVGDGAALVPELARLRRSVEDLADAVRLNRLGETAYHAGKLQESVKRYREALAKSPEFAQCWSNLGLSQWKLKQYADSVSSNRQAIMLARRQGLEQVVANSSYSMGRTFEEQGQTKQALQCMWWANQAVPKDVYRSAIDRLTRKISAEEDSP